MKKTFFGFIICVTLCMFMFFNNTLLADVEVGIKGGIGSFNITTPNYIYYITVGPPDVESIISFQAGVFCSIDISKNFALQPEIYYVMRGTRASKTIEHTPRDYKATLKIDYIEIPILLTYKMPLGNSITPILLVGPYIGFNLSAHNFGEFLFQDVIEMDYRSVISTQYLGLILGGGLEFNLKSMKLILEGRFSYGLSSINVLEERIYESKGFPTNKSFVLMLGIGI